MHIFGKRGLHGLLFAGMVAHAAGACAEVELRVAAQEETAPKYLSDGAGVSGLCVDVLRALERVAPELRFTGGERWMPVVRVLSELYAGRQDAGCGLARTAERDKYLNFLDPPLLTIDFVLVARAADPVAIDGWDDVRKLGIDGVVLGNRGLFAGGLLASIAGIHYDTGSATTAQNLQKLLVGRGRFLILRSQGLNEALRQAGVADRLRVLPAKMGSTRLYFTMGKHVGDQAAARVRQALAQLHASGELERIRLRWYGAAVAPGPLDAVPLPGRWRHRH